MNKRQLALMLNICVGLLCSTGVTHASGVQRTTKEQVSPVVSGKSLKTTERPQKSAKVVSSAGMQRPTKTVQTSPRQKLPAELKPMGSKRGLQVKTRKKVIPKVVVQPRTDLIHYGILEDSQRYDPRPRADSASVPSPQTLDLTHDHFQELDRNQDGMIDPVERAFGRIDMDRDLHTRQLK
jgi:hypothetical protein